jgi:hypothetical protein
LSSVQIPIKVNGITNLQDARFCSALGIKWLSFDLAPGSLYKLPERAVVDMIQWLDGPQLVFNVGDIPFESFEQSVLFPLAQILQFDEQTISSQINWPQEQTCYAFELRSFEAESIARLSYCASQSLFVEVIVDYSDLDSLPQLITPILRDIPNIVLNIDAIPVDILQQLNPFPMAIAARTCIDDGLMQLNFDAVEALLVQFASIAGYDPSTHIG